MQGFGLRLLVEPTYDPNLDGLRAAPIPDTPAGFYKVAHLVSKDWRVVSILVVFLMVRMMVVVVAFLVESSFFW